MKDTNKHSFEEEFKKVFEEAEATPSPVLWAEIDAHLANQEAARYKRRLLYYKISAAAAVVLLVSFIGLWTLNNDLPGENSVALTQTQNANSASAGKSVSQPEHTNETEVASSTEVSSQENSAVASNGFEEKATDNTSLSAHAEKTQPDSKSGHAQESIAIQSPNTNAPVFADTPEITSSLQAKRNSVPAIAPEQGTLAENTQVASVKESTGKQMQQVLAQQQQVSSDAGKKNVNQGLDVANHALAKNQPATKNNISGSNNGTAGELAGNDRIHNDATSPANSRLSNSSLPDNSHSLNVERELYSISPVNRTIAVSGDMYRVQAPAVQTKANPYPFWLEDEEQEEKKQKKTAASKWSVALAFTPSQFDPNMRVSSAPMATASAKQAFSGYNSATNLSTGQTANSASPVSRDLQNAENFGLSYNVGMNVQYALSEKLSLQSGLQYMHNNSQIVTDNYLEDFSNKERYPVFLNVLGANHPATAFITENATLMDQYSVPGAPNTAGIHTNRTLSNTYPGVTQVLVQNLYQYISVPLRLQYKLIDRKLSTSVDRKLSTSVGAGIAADVFLKNTIGNSEANVPEVEFNRQNNNIYKTIGVSGLLSARVNYEFGGRYSVYVEPSYRTALSSFTKSAEVKSLPNSFGVGTGLQYRF